MSKRIDVRDALSKMLIQVSDDSGVYDMESTGLALIQLVHDYYNTPIKDFDSRLKHISNLYNGTKV